MLWNRETIKYLFFLSIFVFIVDVPLICADKSGLKGRLLRATVRLFGLRGSGHSERKNKQQKQEKPKRSCWIDSFLPFSSLESRQRKSVSVNALPKHKLVDDGTFQFIDFDGNVDPDDPFQ